MQTRQLVRAALAVLVLGYSAPTLAEIKIVLKVPVKLQNMHVDVRRFEIRCLLSALNAGVRELTEPERDGQVWDLPVRDLSNTLEVTLTESRKKVTSGLSGYQCFLGLGRQEGLEWRRAGCGAEKSAWCRSTDAKDVVEIQGKLTPKSQTVATKALHFTGVGASGDVGIGATTSATGPAGSNLLEAFAKGTPRFLDQTGIFSDVNARTIDKRFVEYDPNYHLWSDGNKKRRFIYLPQGSKIDTHDMDHWKFPVGTIIVKEFKNPEGTKYLEHRVLVVRESGVYLGTYVWNKYQNGATLNDEGVDDLMGSTWDVPKQSDCHSCHDGESGRVLGVSAIQTRQAFLKTLIKQNSLSHRPSVAAFEPPGSKDDKAALGYLHANCGHCHSPSGMVYNITQTLRLNVGAKSLEDTDIYKTTVGQQLTYWGLGAADERLMGPIKNRIEPGDPKHSAILIRMNSRGDGKGYMMPEIGSSVRDEAGYNILKKWVLGLVPSGFRGAARVVSSPGSNGKDGEGCGPVINEIQMQSKKPLKPHEFVEIYNPCATKVTFDRHWVLEVKGAERSATSTVLKKLDGLSIGPKEYLVITGANYEHSTKGGKPSPKFEPAKAGAKGSGWLTSVAATVSLMNASAVVDSLSWGTASNEGTHRHAVIPPTPGRSLARPLNAANSKNTKRDFMVQFPSPGAPNR